MKAAAFILCAAVAAAAPAPAHAQFGALTKAKKIADKAADTKQKVDDINFTDAEERQLGENVSARLRQRFGVMQDPAITKYVSLVGTVVAMGSSRPALDWKFIVLDTDGVNAYAAPGGYVHITRGLLGLMKNEAELAGVLGHEITHVADKHTIRAIQQGKLLDAGTELGTSKAGFTTEAIAKLGDKLFQHVFEGKWSRGDEDDADQGGIRDANKAGYAPSGLASALQKVEDRNASQAEPNGWFSSHPVIKDRIAKITKQIAAEKLTSKAIVEARYKDHITFDAKPITEIATAVEGAAGLASGDKKKTDDKKDDGSEKKKGGGLSAMSRITGGGKQAQSSQQTASAGARGGVPDRDAKGGSNPTIVAVKVAPDEIVTFKKGIV